MSLQWEKVIRKRGRETPTAGVGTGQTPHWSVVVFSQVG